MDSGNRPEHDYTDSPAEYDMQVEQLTALEPAADSGEIEMQPFDDSTLDLMTGMESTTSTPATTVPATPLSDSSFPSSTSLPLPTHLESRRTSMRRARVEDDHDDERDRRHPSQRLGSPSHPSNTSAPQSSASPSSSTQATTSPPHPLGVPGFLDLLGQSPGPSNATAAVPSAFNSRPFRFYQHMMPFNNPTNHNTALPSTPSLPPFNLPFPQRDNPASGPGSTTISSSSANVVAGPAATPNTPSSSGTNSDATTRPTPRPNLRHQYLGGFAITVDVNGAVTTVPLPGTPPGFAPPRFNADTGAGTGAPPAEGPANDNQTNQPQPAGQPPAGGFAPPPQTQPQPQPQPQGDGGAQPSPIGLNAFADLLRRVSILAALSFGGAGLFDRDSEDPERAKKLVEGLEDVPIGLIRRLERVGKADENDQESNGGDTGSGLGDGGCAICWERLLLEVDETKEEKEKVEEKVRSDATDERSSVSDVDMETQPVASSSSEPSSSSVKLDASTTEAGLEADGDAKTTTNKYQRIVTLPCAHVFHAQCLVPWFSKPKQTTCPICRFNIDPENLTYTSRAQRRAAARRERERARAEGGAGNEEDEGLGEDGEDFGGDGTEGPGVFGVDIPLFMGGTPIVIPARGEVPAANPAAGAPPAGPQGQPTASTANANAHPHDNTAGANNVNAGANDDRPNHDMVTIGFDMYIGRGRPPFSFRGSEAFQIPVPGAAGVPVAAPANFPTGNPLSAMNGNVNNDPAPGGADLPPAMNPGANSGAPPLANEGGNGGARGAAFAIPMGQGFGRALGEVFSRLFGGGPASDGGNPGPTPGAAPAGAGGVTQPQGPVMFGPERPPGPLPGSLPLPANVGLGFGGGMGGRGQMPFVLPFGRGVPGGGTPQPGGQGQQGAQGQQGGQQTTFEATIPLFDLLFGAQGQGQDQPQAQAQPVPQPAQPQPRHPQGTHTPQAPAPAPPGFDWTFVPGSPPVRPASAPVPGQRRQETRKQWTPPPAPGLTLRQRVEKKEQEAGLRCCDVSCGVGPSDDDPWVDVAGEGMKQLSIRSLGDGGLMNASVDSGIGLDGPVKEEGDGEKTEKRKAVCSHTFHSSCLVSAERVALALRDAQVSFVGPQGKEEVEVSCPICRGVGRVSREEWENGLQALA